MGKTKTFRFEDPDDNIVSAYALTKEQQKKVDAIGALLDTETPIGFAVLLAEKVAKKNAEGYTAIWFLKPALGDLISSNPEFFDALCEEGVFDWVAPFVMRKTTEQS